MISKPIFALLFITIIISSFAIMVMTHEATHYVLGETPTGICFGNCNGNPLTFGAVYGIDKNSLGYNEILAWVVGLITASIFFGSWVYVLCKK